VDLRRDTGKEHRGIVTVYRETWKQTFVEYVADDPRHWITNPLFWGRQWDGQRVCVDGLLTYAGGKKKGNQR